MRNDHSIERDEAIVNSAQLSRAQKLIRELEAAVAGRDREIARLRDVVRNQNEIIDSFDVPAADETRAVTA